MTSNTKRIRITVDSGLASVLKEADLAPVLLEKRVTRHESSANFFPAYDPQAAVAGIRAAAGSWKDMHTEAFKAYIAKRRRASSRPRVRL